MADAPLTGCRVAILATHGFEQSELLDPKEALEDAGAEVHVISPETGHIRGWSQGNWGESVHVDVGLSEANPEDYDALVLPGGVMNPDSLRRIPEAVDFVRAFVDGGKPIGAICHGPWTLIETEGLAGRLVTSWPSLRTDLINAGARWVDEEVVTDRGWVTSRKPADLPAFNRKLIEEFSEGRHAALRKERVEKTVQDSARHLQ